MDKYSLVYGASPNFSITTVKKLFKFAKEQNVQDRNEFVIELIKTSTSFVGERDNENLKNGAGEANKKIWSIRCCADELANILVNETDVRLELDLLVQHHLGKMLSDGELLPADIKTYRDQHFKQLLRYLEIIVEATEGRTETLDKGRPPGKRAPYHFYKRLYYLCERHGITPVRITLAGKENSFIHRIRNIIGYDLGIAVGLGEHNGVINKAIKECEDAK